MRMKSVVAALLAVMTAGPAAAVDYTNNLLADVHMATGHPCVIFRLQGVDVADPAVGSAKWFAVSKSHAEFPELFAILLTANAAKRPVQVFTDGGTTCGLASVRLVSLI